MKDEIFVSHLIFENCLGFVFGPYGRLQVGDVTITSGCPAFSSVPSNKPTVSNLLKSHSWPHESFAHLLVLM